MKYKSLFLCMVLLFCGVFTLFGLSGCGEVSLATLKSNFESLDKIYAENSEVFKDGECEGLQTKYLIKYGSTVDQYVTEKKAGYVELKTKYNATFAISNDYIDNNKTYILNFTEDKLSDKSKQAITELNTCLDNYKNSIKNFVAARDSFVDYFVQFNGQLNEEADMAFLRKFKKSYGDMVSKNTAFAMALAKSVETTKIFDLLKVTTPTENDTKIMKEYIRAKMLPIYSEFFITEIENNLNWNGQASTPTKDRIDDLLAKLTSSFDIYKQRFLSSNENLKTLTKEEMTSLFEMVETFFVEVDSYHFALKGLDIKTLAVSYDNNMQEYKKSNALAEVYLEKLEQFIGKVLPNFTNNILGIIY